jgi:hypothetical protein
MNAQTEIVDTRIGEAKLGGELPDLPFKDGIGALRLRPPSPGAAIASCGRNFLSRATTATSLALRGQANSIPARRRSCDGRYRRTTRMNTPP